MRIADLKNLHDDTDWVLSPTLIGLIIGVLGAIATSSTSAPITQQSIGTSTATGPELATGINDQDFNRALPHILRWEGTCSDHWADNGGRTYKGITTEVARKHGWRGDVCKMPDSEVYKIYYKDYWARVPQNLDFPRKLVYFNLLVNGTKKRCLLLPDPESMLDCQLEHYNSLGDRKHFGDGWRNRTNYFKNLVK